MNNEKINSEIETLKSFFTLYCEDKHTNQKKHTFTLNHNNKEFIAEYCLCDDCHKLIGYSFQRLQECPHEIKPRCRKCPNPCYEKDQWKKLAKVMRFSGLKLGLLKVKKVFTFR